MKVINTLFFIYLLKLRVIVFYKLVLRLRVYAHAVYTYRLRFPAQSFVDGKRQSIMVGIKVFIYFVFKREFGI